MSTTGTASTGYEKYANGLPNEEVYTDDKWLPKDNAQPRRWFGGDDGAPKANQNFGPKIGSPSFKLLMGRQGLERLWASFANDPQLVFCAEVRADGQRRRMRREKC